MVFVYLDNLLCYLNLFGYDLFNKVDGLGIELVLFDVVVFLINNFLYYVGFNVILFGEGVFYDVLDVDIIWYEFGYVIYYYMVLDWVYGYIGVLGEGFGDYWVGVYSYCN